MLPFTWCWQTVIWLVTHPESRISAQEFTGHHWALHKAHHFLVTDLDKVCMGISVTMIEQRSFVMPCVRLQGGPWETLAKGVPTILHTSGTTIVVLGTPDRDRNTEITLSPGERRNVQVFDCLVALHHEESELVPFAQGNSLAAGGASGSTYFDNRQVHYHVHYHAHRR